MNREIYKKIREFSVAMYTQGYEEGYEDGKKDNYEIDKLKGHTSKPKYNTPPINRCATCIHKGELKEYCSDCISYYKYEEMCCDNCALNLTECTDLDHFCNYKKWKPKQDKSISDECVDDEIRVGDEVIMYDNCNYNHHKAGKPMV